MTASRPDLPLRGARVLITRAADDAEPLSGRLRALGAEVILLPTLEIVPPADLGALDRALHALDRYHWIAFTSRHAVDAVFGRLIELGLPADLPPDLRVAAVGPSTAGRLVERGVTAPVTPADEEARAFALASVLRQEGVSGQRVLLPGGNLARPELRRALEDAGASVDAVVVYRTVPARRADPAVLDALCHGKIEVVSFASPSAVHNLVAMLGTDTWCLLRARIACIGTTTGDAVRAVDRGLQPVVSERPGVDGLIESIVDAYTDGETE